MLRLLKTLSVLLLLPLAAAAQDLQSILQTHAEEAASPSRQSVGTMLDDLASSGLPEVANFLEAYQDRDVWQRTTDGLFFYAEETEDDLYTLTDISTGEEVGTAPASEMEQVRPNGGVRREIAGALVAFQLSDPDIDRRRTAVEAIARSPSPDQIEPLRRSIEGEADPALLDRKQELASILLALYGEDSEARIEAIGALSGELSVEARSVLNQILSTEQGVAPELPEANIARVLVPGRQLTEAEAYARLVEEDLAPPAPTDDDIRNALAANIEGGTVGGLPVTQLDDPAARYTAYDALAAEGTVPPRVPPEARAAAVESHVFFEAYDEPDPAVTDAARAALDEVRTRVGFGQVADLTLDGLSLASIYFLAAIGLAITFGVMGVINMAHGEFIMIGAYTGYVVQQFVPNYTVSLIIALPLAFVIAAAAGIALERLVIRHLYHRPLETLLATFGISIALQQLAKNIFGTQARPLTSPSWLDGAWIVNDVIQISYIRIAIFVLALIFLGLLLYILKRTRLGLEVRAVTQNPGMAASMGINPDRINMATFGLGSGIAGIAGVAIGLYAQVTSEMGANYIVQSFMTVVVGGVGNVWGTLAGASLIGGLQKSIEWLNPSNTLAAQTYMILFIILFIQFRPKGIVALKGRAAGD
ncbi:urea ABC transporter permease subunit UrtB [Histidinibacterium aquaticum]|uniref:Urea ABC transporter permease subunit UrtB n=1 Tax=Histidinibacterium aquaticum TaxID=2613962 RepID=A0A5J5GIM6_9RHOB|nr:urea ABC transporter permease subunit UrtB [Histidinibacterium aquaticum]KAA9007977.1 urea ABC transporter permease subunit UrtB [Histidinibacterium aquaticum]